MGEICKVTTPPLLGKMRVNGSKKGSDTRKGHYITLALLGQTNDYSL